MQLRDKVALITGSSRGLGRELALAFAAHGADVVVNYLHSEAEAQEVTEQITALGRRALAVMADVSDAVQVERMIGDAVERLGRLDILVNNAGIYKDSPVWKMTADDWSQVIEVNLHGVFNCCKFAIPHMRQQNWGRIINISSVVGQMGVFGTANYAAAKAGISGLTKTVAREVIRKNITANTLCLGYIQAGMLLALPEDVRQSILSQIPMGRFGRAEEVTGAALFLASEQGGYITGQEININGGVYM